MGELLVPNPGHLNDSGASSSAAQPCAPQAGEDGGAGAPGEVVALRDPAEHLTPMVKRVYLVASRARAAAPPG